MMVEYKELSWNPFEGLPVEFLDKLIEYGLQKGDPDCNAFVDEVYEKLDWQKCKIPEVLRPYIKEGHQQNN